MWLRSKRAHLEQTKSGSGITECRFAALPLDLSSALPAVLPCQNGTVAPICAIAFLEVYPADRGDMQSSAKEIAPGRMPGSGRNLSPETASRRFEKRLLSNDVHLSAGIEG